MRFNKIKVNELTPAQYNPRQISKEELNKLTNNLEEFGLVDPIIIDLTDNNTIIGGHQRYSVLKGKYGGTKQLNLIKLGDIGWVFDDTSLKIKDKNHQKALNISLNKISGEWDFPKLDNLLKELDSNKFNMDLTGFEINNLGFSFNETLIESPNLIQQESSSSPTGKLIGKLDGTDSGTLVRDFLVPPFSILSTRKGTWMDRKKYWDNLIQDNGESRENKLMGGAMGVSIFDSALAEVLLKWFLPTNQNCNVCDPFSGDSVIGYVSTALGHTFKGTELRKEQAKLNNNRISSLNSDSIYYCDDGRNLHNYLEKKSQDLLFSCPPYYDLEVYSDLKNDASNQETYEDFYKILDKAFSNTIPCLKNNRFAIIVVGDIRDKNGFYYDFPGDIINTFRQSNMGLYNRIVLENKVGSAALRARQAFKNRKITKVHQNVLVFFKGNPTNIHKEYGKINILVEEGENDN